MSIDNNPPVTGMPTVSTPARNDASEDALESKPARILIVEDDPIVAKVNMKMLSEASYIVQAACDGVEALDLIRKLEFDLVISDLRMPRMDGMTLLAEIAKMPRRPTVILVSAYADIENAVEATRLGAYDVLCKPVERHRLRLAVARAIEHQRLVLLNRRLLLQNAAPLTFGNLVGQDPAMLDIFRVIARIAPTNASILITGESGTGKEQVARAVHEQSRRRGKLLNVIDCTAIPEHLMESVLFGHKKGAFTGAESDHTGLIGYSDGGTVLFDEIGELPAHLQAKLLRLLQERRFTPVGASHEVPIDIRVIAATNRDLNEEVRNGRFRADLFYRLNVVPIHLPPLRERPDDIPALAMHFMSELADEYPNVTSISPEAVKCLQSYPWPGNIRELRNVIERALSLALDGTIQPGDLPQELREDTAIATDAESPEITPDIGTRAQFIAQMEREYLVRLLICHDANITQAAKHAEVGRNTFYRLLKEADLDPEDFRAGF